MAYIFARMSFFLFARLGKKIRCQKGSWGLFCIKKRKKTRIFGIKFAYVKKKQYLCTLKCAYCKCAHAILSAPRASGGK